MKEIIQIHLGHAGSQIAQQSWELLYEEYSSSLHSPSPALLPSKPANIPWDFGPALLIN